MNIDNESLSLLANLCQIVSFTMLSDISNKDLMKDLHFLFENQNNKYLEEILIRLENIENILEKKGIINDENKATL